MSPTSNSTPKCRLLDAVRGTGSREHVVEVICWDSHAPSKEVISYYAFLVKYGQTLEPGHALKIEVYSKAHGFAVPVKEADDETKAYLGEVTANKGFGPRLGYHLSVPHFPVDVGHERKGTILTREKLESMSGVKTQAEMAVECHVSICAISRALERLDLKAKPAKRGPHGQHPRAKRAA